MAEEEDLSFFDLAGIGSIGSEIDQEMLWTLPQQSSPALSSLGSYDSPLLSAGLGGEQYRVRDFGLPQHAAPSVRHQQQPQQPQPQPQPQPQYQQQYQQRHQHQHPHPQQHQYPPQYAPPSSQSSSQHPPQPYYPFSEPSQMQAPYYGQGPLKKSHTLDGQRGLQNYGHPHGPSEFSSPAPRVALPSSNGPLIKSYSLDVNQGLFNGVGKMKARFGLPEGPQGIHHGVPLAEAGRKHSGSFTGRSSPYPNPHALQRAHSLNSFDERAARLAKSESNFSKCESIVSEDDAEGEEIEQNRGTFEWLSEFQSNKNGEGRMPPSDRPRPKPTFKACVNCKKAHLACDAERPCKRCVHIGKVDTCVDVEHKKRGRPKLPRNEDGTIIRTAKDKSDEESDGEPKRDKGPKPKKKGQQRPASPPPSASVPALTAAHPAPRGGAAPSASASSGSPLTGIPLPAPYPYPLNAPAHFAHSAPYQQAESEIEFLSIHTLEGIFTMASPEGEILFGFTPQEYAHQSIYHFVHEEDLEALTELHTKVLASNELQRPVILRFKHKFGGHLKGELAMTVYKNESGRQSLICSTRLLPRSAEISEHSHYSPEYSGKAPESQFYPNPMYSARYVESQPEDYEGRQLQPLQPLQHSSTFDSLSNTLGGMNFQQPRS